MGKRPQFNPSAMPLRRRYDSAMSVDRYSEHSLHVGYRGRHDDSEFLIIYLIN